MYQIFPIAILLVISAVYAAFDVFNKRNVPNLFVYVSVLIGIIVTLAYGAKTIEYSAIIAAIVAVFGYALYKKGFLGGGDFLEFVAVSLIVPMQPAPLLVSTFYQQIPFILSVLFAAGYSVSIYIPLYYLLKRGGGRMHLDRKHMFSAVLLLCSYALLILAMFLLFYIRLTGIIILGTLGIASFFIILFENRIYEGMVSMAYPSTLEPGDMIATNLMPKAEIRYFNKRSAEFGRLVTKKMLHDLGRVRKKLPVYRNSVPFALFIFIGIIISLLLGNLMALILF